LGYTWGHYQFNPGDTTIDGHRQGTGPTSRGYYVTIWKKTNGDWKYVLDTGVAGPKEGSNNSTNLQGRRGRLPRKR
jgi:hypothetical protein